MIFDACLIQAFYLSSYYRVPIQSWYAFNDNFFGEKIASALCNKAVLVFRTIMFVSADSRQNDCYHYAQNMHFWCSDKRGM
ncbi:hypothetical protein CI610_02425 [invertebrate metagenome]|uniref:Uncharacterized protein n=1 Tax=invertebrate metagenome TaxID=1711999 RepID=A0A2H9T5Y6_9ZZZZ